MTPLLTLSSGCACVNLLFTVWYPSFLFPSAHYTYIMESNELPSLQGDIISAEKRGKKTRRGWFSSLFKKANDDNTDPYGLTTAQREKFTKGIPLLEAKAGHSVKSNQWKEASDDYAFLARTYLLLGNRSKCSSQFVNAANCLANEAQKTVDKGNAIQEDSVREELNQTITELLNGQINYLKRACEESQIAGHFTTAANILEDMSKIQCDPQRPQTYNPTEGVETLKEAAKLYTQSGAVQHAIDCLSKLAIVCENEEDFEEAEGLWSECVRHSSEIKILHQSMIHHQISWLLCRIVKIWKSTSSDDIDSAIDSMHSALSDCMTDNPQFNQHRIEYQMITSLIDFIEKAEEKSIEDLLIRPHSSVLTPHQTKLLMRYFGKSSKKKSFFSWR
eukprot:TRINITY_DN6079_c0_g1_i2.p1 TRINITY_DN6079_c0_g1~~TRINITY_DN6079_c0_g1_i2.p1  ORF type:complete len:390 (+),score=72.05 TRINITY_DN6079_c0_g1_i2:370-1539(+)